MMKLQYSNTIRPFFALILFGCLMSCEPSGYERTLRTEYKKNTRHDSLFLGFYLGESREEFFGHGWEVNKQGLIRQGPKNQTVSYILRSPDGNRNIEMLFYPEFDDLSRIKTMPVRFYYMGWSPWNRHLFSDSLLIAIKDTLYQWYGGNEFERVSKNEKQPVEIWYKIDGNRQITLAIVDEKEVKAVIKDLYHKDHDPFK